MKQPPPPITTGNYTGATTSMFITPSILASAEELARKAAELKGLIAPQTASGLARFLEAVDAPLIHGWASTERWGADSMDATVDPAIDPRRRIVAVLGHYDQLLVSEPSGYGAEWISIRHIFERLGLHPHLWRLPRAISRWNKMHADKTGSPELKLAACIEEVNIILDAFNRKNLRKRILHAFSSNKLMLDTGLRSITGSAVLNIFIQGSQPSSEFRTFTGLSTAESEQELSRLINLGIVVSSSGKPDWLEAELPTWFAFEILATAAKAPSTPD